MGFSSSTFLFIFLPFSIIIYLISDHFFQTRGQNNVLIILSLAFYAWGSLDTLFIVILYSFVVYLLGQLIYKRSSQTQIKQWIHKIFIIISVGYLFVCKYLPFFINSFSSYFGVRQNFSLTLIPLGLSFMTFESISYIIDIYRGDAKPGNLQQTFLFMLLFTKVISGPIVLWKDTENQFKLREVNGSLIESGIIKIINGYALKIIFADYFGEVIYSINRTVILGGGLDTISSGVVLLKTILYFFQIYMDFAGYSLIAIGLSNIFGFNFKQNFNSPYISLSITEFWRRWHISLGTWFREYLYIPLGGNRKGNVYFNLFIVFLITGIWHGANWTYFLWGITNAICVIVERFIRNKSFYQNIPSIIKLIITTLIIWFQWIIFSSDSISDLLKTLHKITSLDYGTNYSLKYYLSIKTIVIIAIAIIISLRDIIKRSIGKKYDLSKITISPVIQKSWHICLFLSVIICSINSTYSPFIYFQY